MNWNGFYKLTSIQTNDELKTFFREALSLSTSSHVDILESGESTRKRYPKITPEEYIETELDLDNHNVCIDRWVYSNYSSHSKHGDIGSSNYRKDDDLFLFITLPLESLYILVEKYNLTKL